MGTSIERVALTNYKSIKACDVALRPLTVIVGRNGSGKSNFLDSLHFIADSLATSLEYAIRKRGGISELAYRGPSPKIRIEISFRTHNGRVGKYLLILTRVGVRQESLTLCTHDGEPVAQYKRVGNRLTGASYGEPLASPPKVLPDRLALVTLSGLEVFRESFDTLAAMRFYRLNPEAMREVHDADEGAVLREDGSNISSVWGRLEKTNNKLRRRLTEYLSVMVPDLKTVHRKTLGPKESLHFHQKRPGKRELMFFAQSMSDGTLRALGALVAAGQSGATVVGIEEPETALHPGAVAALMDALHEASGKTQIIVTSHSPDVVDHVDVTRDALLITESRDGATTVAEIDPASREAIRRHLYTPGDLLRMDQLQPALPS